MFYLVSMNSMQMQTVENFVQLLLNHYKAKNEIDHIILTYLTTNKLNLSHSNVLNFSNRREEKNTSLEQELLQLALIAFWEKNDSELLKNLKDQWYLLLKDQTLYKSQVKRVYLHLIAKLLNIPFTHSQEIEQRTNGILPLSTDCNDLLLNKPFIDIHAEFATLLILAGSQLKLSKWIKQGYQAALWHKQNVNYQYLPYRSFMSNHQTTNYISVCVKQAILFHVASLAMDDAEMAYLADHNFNNIINSDLPHAFSLSLDQAFSVKWAYHLYSKHPMLTKPHLSVLIEDREEPVLAKRTENIDVLISLMGNNTSMGSLRFKELELVAFGPQYQDLGNGENFGFIDQSFRKDYFKKFKEGSNLALSGIIALPVQESEAPYSTRWKYSTGWLEAKLNFDGSNLDIEINPLKVFYNFSFVFYIIAEQCLIKGQKKISHQSLEQFEGKADSVAFLHNHSSMIIDVTQGDTSMKIIPLEGKISFWGAKYLVAFDLKNSLDTFKWSIRCNNV